MDKQVMISRLPLKNWAKTIAEDFELYDELLEHEILVAHTREVYDNMQWIIYAVESAGDVTGRRYLRVKAIGETHDGEKRRISIRIYSPKLPRISMLSDYVGRTLAGGQFLCTIRDGNEHDVVAYFIRTVDSTGKKSNPITIQHEESSSFIDQDYCYSNDKVDEYDKLPLFSIVELASTLHQLSKI